MAAKIRVSLINTLILSNLDQQAGPDIDHAGPDN